MWVLMNFKQLIDYIKKDGCRVRIYKKWNLVDGCSGTFHITKKGPLISMAIRGLNEIERYEVLLHEYAHHLQWRDGFMQYIDGICDAYRLENDWLAGRVELSSTEKRVVRNCILTMEYDAEKRAVDLIEKLKIEKINKKYFLRGAEAYTWGTKWSFARRRGFIECPKRSRFKGVLLDTTELYRDLTRSELASIEREIIPAK